MVQVPRCNMLRGGGHHFLPILLFTTLAPSFNLAAPVGEDAGEVSKEYGLNDKSFSCPPIFFD